MQITQSVQNFRFWKCNLDLEMAQGDKHEFHNSDNLTSSNGNNTTVHPLSQSRQWVYKVHSINHHHFKASHKEKQMMKEWTLDRRTSVEPLNIINILMVLKHFQTYANLMQDHCSTGPNTIIRLLAVIVIWWSVCNVSVQQVVVEQLCLVVFNRSREQGTEGPITFFLSKL